MLDACIAEAVYAQTVRGKLLDSSRGQKRSRTEEETRVPVLLGTLLDKHGRKNKDKRNIKHLRMLADTGSTGSIIDKRHVDKRDLR